MASQHRKHRGYATERAVADYLRTWWQGASVQRGNGKDVINVPYDLEIKSRSNFSPMEWLRQSKARAKSSGELSAVVVRMNGQGTTKVGEYLAFLSFDDFVQLLLRAGYGDMQADTKNLIPERCRICGTWKFENCACRTCALCKDNK